MTPLHCRCGGLLDVCTASYGRSRLSSFLDEVEETGAVPLWGAVLGDAWLRHEWATCRDPDLMQLFLKRFGENLTWDRSVVAVVLLSQHYPRRFRFAGWRANAVRRAVSRPPTLARILLVLSDPDA